MTHTNLLLNITKANDSRPASASALKEAEISESANYIFIC